MEEYKKSTRSSRKDTNKTKSNAFFGSKKHIRIQLEKQNKDKPQKLMKSKI